MTNDLSINKLAGLTGVGYLLIFITGIYANFFVLENLIVTGDAVLTTTNLSANAMLLRTGIMSFVIMVVLDVLLAWSLYIIFKPVNKNLSLLSGWLRLVNATVFSIALYHLLGVVHLTAGPDYLKTMASDQISAHIMISIAAFNNTWLIGLIFFGLHLPLLGYLAIRSGFIPKILGILLIIAGAGYLIDSMANFLFVGYADYKDFFSMIVIVPGIIGELSFTLWLLLKGVKKQPETSTG